MEGQPLIDDSVTMKSKWNWHLKSGVLHRQEYSEQFTPKIYMKENMTGI